MYIYKYISLHSGSGSLNPQKPITPISLLSATHVGLIPLSHGEGKCKSGQGEHAVFAIIYVWVYQSLYIYIYTYDHMFTLIHI